MTDSPSSDDDRGSDRRPPNEDPDSGPDQRTPTGDPDSGPDQRTPTEESDPGTPDSPLLFGVTLWRDSVVAAFGLLVLAAGAEGWWFFVGNGFDQWEYTVIDLVGDLAFVFAGTFLVFVAAGAAARRVRGT